MTVGVLNRVEFHQNFTSALRRRPRGLPRRCHRVVLAVDVSGHGEAGRGLAEPLAYHGSGHSALAAAYCSRDRCRSVIAAMIVSRGHLPVCDRVGSTGRTGPPLGAFVVAPEPALRVVDDVTHHAGVRSRCPVKAASDTAGCLAIYRCPSQLVVRDRIDRGSRCSTPRHARRAKPRPTRIPAIPPT